ncbi:hypothetical protein GW17_00049879 [Ensete ventricosum]|nr:hypothetical protein GW17_00049879 [Ensete ventricosum]
MRAELIHDDDAYIWAMWLDSALHDGAPSHAAPPWPDGGEALSSGQENMISNPKSAVSAGSPTPGTTVSVLSWHRLRVGHRVPLPVKHQQRRPQQLQRRRRRRVLALLRPRLPPHPLLPLVGPVHTLHFGMKRRTK